MRQHVPLGILILTAAPALAQDVEPPADATVAHARQAAEFAEAEAGRYRFRSGGEELDADRQVVLRWSNPTGAEVHGAVVLWTRGGCPLAAASAYRFFDRQQVNVELVSLAESPLEVERAGRVRWTPQAGVEFQPVPGADEPAATAAARRRQARQLARRFSGSITDKPEEERSSALRLLERPLHEYAAEDGSGREGAVFALVTATDPEIVLLIESRPAKGRREWLYAAARMHFRPLRLALDEEPAWEAEQAAPPWDAIRGPEGEYVILEWRTFEAAERD